jgi:hypothetical protein
MWIIFGFSLTYGDSLGGFIGSPATFPLLLELIGQKKGTGCGFAILLNANLMHLLFH